MTPHDLKSALNKGCAGVSGVLQFYRKRSRRSQKVVAQLMGFKGPNPVSKAEQQAGLPVAVRKLLSHRNELIDWAQATKCPDYVFENLSEVFMCEWQQKLGGEKRCGGQCLANKIIKAE